MVRLNNSFDGVTSSSAVDAYIRNIHDCRMEIEVACLGIINFINSQKEKPLIIPSLQFETVRPFIVYLSHVYHKNQAEFVCIDDINSKFYLYKKELDLIAGLIQASRKYYSYCLNDVVDFYLDNDLSLRDLLVPKNLVYATDKVRKEYHKYLPDGFEQVITEYKLLESKDNFNNEIEVENLYKNPKNLYFKLLEEIVDRAIDYLLLQLYDFLIEETNKTNEILVIKSNKLIQIWDDLNFVSQNQRCKPSLDGKIKLSPLSKNRLKGKDDFFDYVMEEWAANLNRAIELKIKLGMDFMKYLNTSADEETKRNYQNHTYPILNGLVKFVERKIGLDQMSKSSTRVDFRLF
jgi:hypothetical protein